MIVLAFDTCFGACSAAMFQHAAHGARNGVAGAVLAARDEPMAVGHAERLMPMIAEVMAESGLSFAGLDAIAVTCGPGTFTGVRTGIAAARGLALATGLPVLGITSLELLVRTFDATETATDAAVPLTVCMAAGKGQLYAQAFGARAIDVDRMPISEPMLTTADQVAASLAGQPSIVVGSAAQIVGEIVGKLVGGQGASVRAALLAGQPSARYMQGAMLQRYSPVRPLYLREPDAIPPADKALPRVAS